MAASPYFVASLLSAHGHHRVTTDFSGGVTAVAFHHDGEEADHSHDNHGHEDNGSHSTDKGDHQTTVSANIAAFSSSSAQALVKVAPVISFVAILEDLSCAQTAYTRQRFPVDWSERTIASSINLRTVVLLI